MTFNETIGVVGLGVVGNAIYKGFSSHYKTYGYDKDHKKNIDSIEKIISCEYIILCLPTPYIENIGADNTNINEALSLITSHDNYKKLKNKPIFILKSTVSIGTTATLQKKYKINIAHCPEFLSERTAEIDFVNSDKLIVGSNNKKVSQKIIKLFQKRFLDINIISVSPEESELIKYIMNCFYATKIMFFNETKLLSDKLNCNWENVITGVLSSKWIEKMHTMVPGPDGKLGFGGSCFPKDTEAFLHIFKSNNVENLVLQSVIEQNKKIRK